MASLWRKLFKRYGDDDIGQLAVKVGLEVAEAVLALKRPPVCLSCGGARVTPLRLPRFEFWNASRIYALGAWHPGCGGSLAARSSDGERVAVAPMTRIHDIHGQLLSEREGWS